MSKNQSSHSHDHSHDHGGHDHSHDHGGHDHSHGGGLGGHTHDLRGASKRHLKYALFLITGYMFVEVVGGIISGSLALIADAGHMLTDAASIGLALVAMYYAERTATAKHTYGFQRFEILAALANALTLWLIVAVILYQAYQRLSSPPEIEGGLMLAVGFVGLLVNVGAAVILHKSIGHSVNVEGAYQHVIADLLGSVGVVISGILIWAFGWQLADLVVTVILSILILWGTWGLLKRVVHVLLEGVPKHVDVHEMCRAIEELPGVALIHDIHVWTLSPGSDALTAHILIDPDYGGKRDEMLRSLRKIIGDDYGIAHLTIQLETQLTGCTEDHHVDNLLALAKM
ncbi:MAG: cation diffusion facilitator family transporter [Bacteroidota bacterium]|nr:cation diffusion facilitator family transporter [Bacteroidota bacterium]MDE2826335.1 cation diffusion facilitator family transporter [Bacteroidota bacterium]